jgi:hypothetical protein
MEGYTEKDILELELDDFAAMLIREGKFDSKRDVKIFIIEQIQALQKDPTTEWPIKYFEGADAEIEPEIIPYEGEAMDDDMVKRIKSSPSELDDNMTVDEYMEQEKLNEK